VGRISLQSIFNLFTKMETIIFCAACFIGKIYGAPLFGDPDVQWHLMAGKYITATGHIPQNDPWSYASVGQVWFNLSWLWDVIISSIYQVIGLDGMCNLAVVLHASVLVLLFRELKGTYKVPHEDTALAATAISGLILLGSLYMRPQLGAYFLLLALMKVLEGYRGRANYLTALYMAVITVIWVNVHGTFLLIWVIGGVYLLESLLEKKWRDARFLGSIGVMALAVSLINPWGWDVYVGTIRTLHTVIRPYISEWKPFVFGTQYGPTMALVIILATGFMQNEMALRYRILAAFVLLNALMAIRNWQIFAIVGAPFVALSFERIYACVKPQKNIPLKKYGQPACAAVSIALMLFSFTISKPVDRENTPLDEINFVVQNYAGKYVYNEYDHGGPMIFYGQGRIKHFMDGRAGTAFSEETMEKYVSFLKDEQSWDGLFNDFPTDVAIVAKSSFRKVKTQDFFDNWYLVFEGKVAKVYAKEEPKAKPVVLVP